MLIFSCKYTLRRFSEVAYKIDIEKCVQCGACQANCPVDCIAEENGNYVIDADACVECGTCEANCPVGAASAE